MEPPQRPHPQVVEPRGSYHDIQLTLRRYKDLLLVLERLKRQNIRPSHRLDHIIEAIRTIILSLQRRVAVVAG